VNEFLIDGPQIGEKENTCYIPFFATAVLGNTDWYMGNMFLQTYYTVFDINE
jgi:hypothetical protein